MKTVLAAALLIAVPLTACGGSENAKVATASEIAWRHGDVADALAEAKEQNKPVLLYWGAVWCPPCNQMKATLFRDPAFIGKTQNFVPVYLDGDTKGAQQWGERFGISGYPTVIVLSPDGHEVTRIAGGTMAGELPALLDTAAGRTVPVEQLLATATNDPKKLSADDWRILAGYDWFNDPKHFPDPTKLTPVLRNLSSAAPSPELSRRFALLALATVDGKLSPADQQTLATVLPQVLANPAELRANREVVSYELPERVAELPEPAQRSTLSDSLVKASDALFADETLSTGERLNATQIDVALTKANGKTDPSVLAKVRQRVAWANGAARDKIERQAVIDDAAYLLFGAGDHAGARKLAEGELKSSDQPYYYMSSLSDFAEQDGDKRGAVEWARKAYEASEGRATRVQWAINYSLSVLRNTPDDKAGVRKSTDAVLAELGKAGDYFQRTRNKTNKWMATLQEWGKAHGGEALAAGVAQKLKTLCGGAGCEKPATA